MKTSRKFFGKTKIVCTLGPSSNSVKTLTAMIRSGMDMARINFSHGTYKEALKTFIAIRKAAALTGEPIGVIQDLQGPKLRIGCLKKESVLLKANRKITITTKEVTGDEHIISTTYKQLPYDLKIRDKVLIDDGKIELRVEKIKGQNILCTVVTGGTLSSHKGINLPGTIISSPSLTDKDKEDLKFAFKHDVDFVALSFIRKSSDIKELRSFIIKNGPRGREIPIIAKIEKPEAVSDIDSIIKEADAVMVARGDLGVEMPAEDVPVLQKMIVRKCNEVGKPVIIATQMLESMIQSPRPTRAEATDVANAVFDGADAVMLSGETSVGKYPIQAVGIMDKIIRKTESCIPERKVYEEKDITCIHDYDPLCNSACVLAGKICAKVIVSITHSGETAMRVAKFRPSARIIAVTDREKIMRRLNLVWGIRGLIVKNLKRNTDATFKMIQDQLVVDGYVKRGEPIVMTAGIPVFKKHSTNTIKVDKI